MRKTFLGTVALAAIVLAASSISQPGHAQPAPGQGLGAQPGPPGRQQERPAAERPAGAERALERAQERAQERGAERAQERGPERSAQPGRPDEARPDMPRPPRAAEPASPPTQPDRRNAESERPNMPARTNDDRSDGPRNPRAAEPAAPAQPASPQREAQPARPDNNGRIEPARPRAAEPANPPTPAAQQREAQPTPPRTAPPSPTAQPAPATTPPQPGSAAARSPATPDQERAINETIERQVERREVRPERDIGVSVSVGTSLPDRVRIDRLPREIVNIRPQYRDYGVVVTERETVIVDPRTRRVVEVIDRRGGRNSETILVERIERGNVREWRNPRVDIREDIILPAEAPLVELPSEYVERMPRYRGYRYVASGDEIAIVEPKSRRVVEVIDRKQAKSTRAAPMTTASTSAVTISRDERDEINRMLLQRAGPGALHSIRELRGSTLPSSLEIERLPAAVAEKFPSLRGMSYVLIGDDVLIVDPENRRVVDVIE